VELQKLEEVKKFSIFTQAQFKKFSLFTKSLHGRVYWNSTSAKIVIVLGFNPNESNFILKTDKLDSSST
jgi:hypothetical protein